jgi:hypothetical protein
MGRLILLLAALCGLGFALLGTCPAAADGPAADELRVLKTLPVGGTGGWDYPTIDPAAKRTITGDPASHRAYLPATLPAEGGASQFGVVVVGLAGGKE